MEKVTILTLSRKCVRLWWLTPLIPTLGRQRQIDLCEFAASLVYRVSSRTFRAIQRNHVSKDEVRGWGELFLRFPYAIFKMS